MKKLLFLLLFSLFFVEQTEANTGYYHKDSVLIQLRDYKTLVKQLDSLTIIYDKEKLRMKNKLKTLEKEFNRDSLAQMLTGDYLLLRQQELSEYKSRIVRFRDYCTNDLMTRKSEGLAKIYDRILRAAEIVGRKLNLTSVIDASQSVVLPQDQLIDITIDVVEEANSII